MTEEVEIGMTITIPGTFGNVKVHIRREKLDGETHEQHRKRVRDEVRTEVKRQMRDYGRLEGWDGETTE